MIFYGVGIGRIIVSMIRSGATGTDLLGQMIDLATLANISIVVMDEPCHGYYVHGKAPWGKADIPLHVMQKKLQDEVSGELGQRSRGLKNNKLPNADSKIQSFEIYLPKSLRDELSRIRQRNPTDSMLEKISSKNTKQIAKEEDDLADEDQAPADRSASAQWSPKERNIRKDEWKKAKISELLKNNIGDKLQAEDIKGSTYWTRWAGAPPD